MFSPEPNTHFFRVQLMGYTFHSQDQTFLMYCSFSDSNHQQHQVRWNGNRKQISFPTLKNSFFVNIKSVSIKEVNLPTKGQAYSKWSIKK